MKCIGCNEQVESGYDQWGRCRVCRKHELERELAGDR